MNMPPDVEARIRALPGNGVCCDCSNVNPQWASVTYGCLMCLECSGHHRSLGVHLSFVRSIQMDSWTPKQIEAMEKSGGNKSLVDYLKSRGIEKNMPIHNKYNTKQAAYVKDRLARWLEGKREPPPDPGQYDPATGGSDAQGAEPLPGETTEQYNARQARLREAARERMRQKFGGGGMSGVGSSGNSASGGFQDDDDWGAGLGGAVGAVGGAVGAVAGGVGSFLKNKVVDNDDLHSSIRGAAGSATQTATNAWSMLRQTVAEGDLTDSLKRNATLQEGSIVSKGLGWGMGAVGSLWETASTGLGSVTGALADDSRGSKPAYQQGPRCLQGHGLRISPEPTMKCSGCGVMGTRYACSQGCSYDVCTKCYDKPPEPDVPEKPPPPIPTGEDMQRMARELGMDLNPSSPAKSPQRGGSTPGSSPTKQQAPVSSTGSSSVKGSPPGGSPRVVESTSPSAAPKAKAKDKLPEADDFFSEFGV